LDVSGNAVNPVFLEMLLEEMDRYSRFLQRMVRQMLTLEKQPRLDEIEMVLDPYRDQIRKLQPFQAKR
jgi:hypothetical protein